MHSLDKLTGSSSQTWVKLVQPSLVHTLTCDSAFTYIMWHVGLAGSLRAVPSQRCKPLLASSGSGALGSVLNLSEPRLSAAE